MTDADRTESLSGSASRRTFLSRGLVGGLAFLAACSSSTGSNDNAIVLGADEPEPADTAVTPAAPAETDPVAEPVAVDPAQPTPTPDPERVPIMPVDFTYLDGSAGSFDDFEGTPLVINFFAGWCPPCRAELPDFEEISQKYKGQVEFLGFSVLDDVETTQKLLDETGVTFTVAMDPTQDIHFDLGGIAMPTTLFIDRHGSVASGRFGAIPKDDLEAMILEEIL